MPDSSKVINKFQEAKREAESARAPREKKWLIWYELYKSYTKMRTDGKSNLFIPYTFSLVETVLPRITRTLFASRPYVGIVPRRPQFVDDAKIMEEYFDYLWCDRMKMPYNFHLWAKQCLMYGYSPAKVTWEKKSRKMKRKVPNYFMNVPLKPLLLGYVDQEEEQVLYNAPKFELIDIFDFWLDPMATCIDDSRYCIQRSYLTEDEIRLRAEEGLYKNINKLFEQEGTNIGENRSRRLSGIGIDWGIQNTKGIYTVDEYWEDNRLIVVGNDEVLLQDDENPFWHGKKPYVELIDQPMPFEAYSTGEVEPVEFLQYELNTLRNQRMDNVNLTLNSMWLRRRNADIADSDLVSRPGGIIDVDSLDGDIRQVEFKHVTGESYREEQIIKSDIQNASGVFDHVRGVSSAKEDTATEVIRLQQAAEARFYEKVMIMEYAGIQPLLYRMDGLVKQFLTENEEIPKVTGDMVQFVEVTPDTVAGQYDYITMSSSMDSIANKQVKQQQLAMMYKLAGQDPLINRYEFLKLMFKSHDIKEVDRLLVDEQMAKALQMAQLGVPPNNTPSPGGTPNNMFGDNGSVPGAAGSAQQMDQMQMEDVAHSTVEGMYGRQL